MGSERMQRCLLLLGLVLGAAAASASDKLYRYHDSEGVLVINHTLPARYVADGYEVLDGRGRLLEVVAPPQPVPFPDDADGDRLRQGDLDALDRMLRASYSSSHQIEAARDRRLAQIERQVTLIQATLTQTAGALTRERERAARYERADDAVPAGILNNLKTLRGQRDSTAHSLRIREAELAAVQRQYALYLSRFALLAGEEG